MHRRHAPTRLLAALALALLASAAGAHDLQLTDTLIVLKSNGTYQVDMVCDLDALALGVSPTADSAALAAELASLETAELEARLEKLRDVFRRRVRLRFDGRVEQPRVSFPERGTALAEEAEIPTFLGLVARLEGRVPEGSRELTFRASRAFPPVHLTVLDQATATGFKALLEQGVPSEPIALDRPLKTPGTFEVASRYLGLGFRHILPAGIDHVLFVLGLFLLSARLRPLFWQVTAFTLAHTATLALSSLGIVSLSPRVVEPLIALSIAYVAFENAAVAELKPWRPALVFAFGLLHGLGFAGVLGELGLPAGERAAALVGFNLGVELGQLAVILAAFLSVGWLRDRPWYRRRVVLPGSLAIGVVGLYWAVERAF